MHPAIELLLIIILPLLLILTKIIRYHARFYLLTLVVVGATVTFIFDKTPLKTIGLRVDNLWSAIGAYLLFSAAGCLLIFLFARAIHASPTTDWKRDAHFQYLFIPISIAQQYVFMSFSLPRIESLVNNAVLAILLNAALFTLMHLGYGSLKRNLPLAIMAGIGFSTLYFYFPNLIVSSLAHMTLNLTAVYFGFFTVKKSLVLNSKQAQ